MDDYGISLIFLLSFFTVSWLILCYVGRKLDQEVKKVQNSGLIKIFNRSKSSKKTEIFRHQPRRNSLQEIISANYSANSIQQTKEIKRRQSQVEDSEKLKWINFLQDNKSPNSDPRDNREVHQQNDQSPQDYSIRTIETQRHRPSKNINILQTVQEIQEDFSPQKKAPLSISSEKKINKFRFYPLETNKKKLQLDTQDYKSPQSQAFKSPQSLAQESIQDEQQISINTSPYGGINQKQQMSNQSKKRRHSTAVHPENFQQRQLFKNLTINSYQNLPEVSSAKTINVNGKIVSPDSPENSVIELIQPKQKKQQNIRQLENMNVFLKIFKKQNPKVNRSYKFTQLYVRYMEVQMFVCLGLYFELDQRFSDYFICLSSIGIIILKRIIDYQLLKKIKQSNYPELGHTNSLKYLIFLLNVIEIQSSWCVIIYQLITSYNYEKWFYDGLPGTVFDLILLDFFIFIFYCLGLTDKKKKFKAQE